MTDIQKILDELFSYQPANVTSMAQAMRLADDQDELIKRLVWKICRFNNDIDLHENLSNNSCFFRSEEKKEGYFIAKDYLLPNLETNLVKEEIISFNFPKYGFESDEKLKLLESHLSKKDSSAEFYFLDIFLPRNATMDLDSLKITYKELVHYVLSISKYSLFLSKFEMEDFVTK